MLDTTTALSPILQQPVMLTQVQERLERLDRAIEQVRDRQDGSSFCKSSQKHTLNLNVIYP